jgi:hypothetical protein
MGTTPEKVKAQEIFIFLVHQLSHLSKVPPTHGLLRGFSPMLRRAPRHIVGAKLSHHEIWVQPNEQTWMLETSLMVRL